MKRHAAEVHGEGRSELLYCDTCEYGTNRQRDLERHIINVHHSNRPQKGGETLNKSSREGGEKRRSATTQPTPTKKKLIIKIKPPGAPSALADYLPESETTTNEAEESRRRTLPRIPLLPTPHTDVMGEYVREEGDTEQTARGDSHASCHSGARAPRTPGELHRFYSLRLDRKRPRRSIGG